MDAQNSMTDSDKDRLADILMQRMAQHAPVTQRYSPDGRWLLIWGNGAVGEEGPTRFEAVMKIVDNLLSASAVADPRIAAPSSKRYPPPGEDLDDNVADPDEDESDPVGELKEGSVDVDSASDDSNDPA